MTYPKITLVKLVDDSGYYELWIRALASSEKDGNKLPPKISFEIRHISNKEDIRSFRTSKQLKIEDLMTALAKAYAFVEAEKGRFGDGFDQKVDHQLLNERLRDFAGRLFEKMRIAISDGVKASEEL